MKQRIYIDTSIVGGYFDDEFKDAIIKLFERLENNEIIFVVSDLLDLELLGAPKRVRAYTEISSKQVSTSGFNTGSCLVGRQLHPGKRSRANEFGRLSSYSFGNDQ
jgi:hypothetical protein